MYTQIWLKNLYRSGCVSNTGVHGMMISKWIYEGVKVVPGLNGLRKNQTVGLFKHSNEPSGSTGARNFLSG
jgi:hypothetical protein